MRSRASVGSREDGCPDGQVGLSDRLGSEGNGGNQEGGQDRGDEENDYEDVLELGEQQAFAPLMDLLAGASVQCRPTKKYLNGCAIAYCRADGFDLSANMVHTGWALAAPEASSRYTTIEDKAKAGKRGLWRGRFVKPWDWRSQ